MKAQLTSVRQCVTKQKKLLEEILFRSTSQNRKIKFQSTDILGRVEQTQELILTNATEVVAKEPYSLLCPKVTSL